MVVILDFGYRRIQSCNKPPLPPWTPDRKLSAKSESSKSIQDDFASPFVVLVPFLLNSIRLRSCIRSLRKLNNPHSM